MPVTCTKISSKTGINVRDLVKIPISAINRKSTYPILELNFSSSSREKDNPERSCGSSNERFSRRRRKKTKKKEKKVREEQNVSSRQRIRFLSRLFFVCHASLFWGMDRYY